MTERLDRATPEELRATVTFLQEELGQARHDADAMLARANAAEARIDEARAETARLREERGQLCLQWTDLGQALLDGARAWRATGEGAALAAALDAIAAEEARDIAQRYPNRRRVG